MRQFTDGINFKSDSIKEAVEKTALKHIEFERIHPFNDGNGRTGRIVLNQMLINNDLLPIAILPKSRYIQSFKRYDKTGDISVLEKVILECELESANKVAELFRKFEKSMEQPRIIVKRNSEEGK